MAVCKPQERKEKRNFSIRHLKFHSEIIFTKLSINLSFHEIRYKCSNDQSRNPSLSLIVCILVVTNIPKADRANLRMAIKLIQDRAHAF